MGYIIGIAGRLESALGTLLALLSRGSAPITISMFHSVTSTDAQKAMLLAAAAHTLRGAELESFQELMEDFRPRYGERSKLVHNVWGDSAEHPDKALWWKSADIGTTVAKAAAAPDAAALSHAIQADDLSLKAMLYTVKDLEDAAHRLDEYTNRVFAFIGQLWNAHPALVAATTAATSAQPIGETPQLKLNQTQPQTAP